MMSTTSAEFRSWSGIDSVPRPSLSEERIHNASITEPIVPSHWLSSVEMGRPASSSDASR
jgi:hypothetical protein